MQIGEFKNTPASKRTLERIGKLALEKHVAELDSQGFTVVPPSKVADRALFEPLQATVLRLCRQRTGVDFQLGRNRAFEKKTDSLRLNVTSYHCHRRLKNQENYQWRVTPEMLERNPPEFARLVGADDQMGRDERGPDYSRLARYGSPEVKRRFAAASRKSDGERAAAA